MAVATTSNPIGHPSKSLFIGQQRIGDGLTSKYIYVKK
jgi:hypothetical protein